MQGRKTKAMGMLLSAAAIAALVGCSSTKTAPPSAGNGAADAKGKGAAEAPAGDKLPLASPPVTVDYMTLDNPTEPMLATAPVLAELAKRTGVNFNFIKTDAASYDDKFKITMASGKFPDIIYSKPEDMKLYGPQGAFLQLDDLLEKYGQNILKAMKDRDIYNEMKAGDGHIYGLPKIRESISANSWIVRQDWLDKYGIKTPTNLDEYYTMLKTIKEKDPAGGGKTIPLGFFGLPESFNEFYMEYGAHWTFFLKDGKMVFGPAEPQMKDALAYVKKLYTEKLVDQDFSVLSKQQWQARGSNGQYGSIIYNSQRTDYFTQILQKTDPNAKMIAITPIKGADGRQIAAPQKLVGNVAVLGKDTKKAELLIKLFNYEFSPEGQQMMSYGVLGDSYEMKDGKPQYTAKMYEKPKSTYQDMFHEYGMFGWTIPVNPVANIDEQMFKGTLTGEAIKLQSPYYVKTNMTPSLTFTDQENAAMKGKLTNLRDLANQYEMKFITGQTSLDTGWDEFMGKLKAAGLDECLKIYNDAYVRYSK